MNKKDPALAANRPPSMGHSAVPQAEASEVLSPAESMEKALLDGIPTELLLQKLKEGLSATTAKTPPKGSSTTDAKEFPDHPTRLRYIEKITLFSGRYRPKAAPRHAGKDAGPVEAKALTRDELEQRIQWLERKLGISPPAGPDGGALPPPPGEPEAG